MKDRIRMEYIYNIRNNIMNFFYRQKAIDTDRKLWSIAIRNQNVLDAVSATFVFEGDWYGDVPHDPEKKKLANRRLHPDFLPKVAELVISKEFNHETEAAKISGLLSNILLASGHMSDLYELLPPNFLKGLPGIDAAIFNIRQPLTPEQVNTIKVNNVEGFACLNELSLRNLLLRKQDNI